MTAIRRPGNASVAVLLALGAGLVAAHVIAPEWSRRVGLDVWNLPSETTLLRDATERHEEVLEDADRAARRREAASQIATKLINGTASLPEAADEIAELFRDEPGMSLTICINFQNEPTDRHRFARHAIQRAKRLLVDDPTHSAAVVARLEAEYRAMLGSPDAPTHGEK